MISTKLKALKYALRKPDTGAFIKSKGGDTTAALLNKYAYRITDTVKSTINGDLDSDAVAKQYIPQNRELQILPEERLDPIGDDAHSPVKGIVHRYPDRVLFTPANVCAVYCRYCFRREKVGLRGENIPDILGKEELNNALNYIRAHSEIWEVILTGGDPLVLAPRQLENIMAKLRKIDHVKIIRFHTRVPVADPKRINAALIKALKENTDQSVYMALHINHAQELNDDNRKAIKDLHAAGITLLSQSVLLKGINDNADILASLYRELVSLNVKPYYLHHPDLAPGTSHFRLSIKDGQNIVRKLHGKLSGLCQPQYMLDIPGGFGKISLLSDSIKPHGNGTYTLTDYKGNEHAYPPPLKTRGA